MIRRFIIPEYRLVIPGRAVSFRSPSARDYKRRIQVYAKEIIDRPLEGSFDIYIDYFHPNERRMDMDNIAKCIMDALNGIAYADDRQVRLQKSVGYYLQNVVRIEGGPIDIIKPLKRYEEYVFIRLRQMSV